MLLNFTTRTMFAGPNFTKKRSGGGVHVSIFVTEISSSTFLGGGPNFSGGSKFCSEICSGGGGGGGGDNKISSGGNQF